MDYRVNVFLDNQQAKFVAQEAARLGRSPPEVVRKAVDYFMSSAFARRCQEDTANKGFNGNGK